MELKSSNRKRCEICIEFKSSNEMFVNKDRCAHSICTDCIVKHIIARVEDNVAEIRCPYWLICKQILDLHTCRQIIPKSLFVKWCDVLCNLAIQPNKKSYCPNKKCLELVINECGGIVKRSECPKCKQLYCFQCNLQWPECNNCERIEENDQIFKELAVSKKWVKCPTCDYHVERISGCRHMSCRFDRLLYFCFILTFFYYVLQGTPKFKSFYCFFLFPPIAHTLTNIFKCSFVILTNHLGKSS